MKSAEQSVDLNRWIVGAARHASLTVASLTGVMLLSLGGAAGSTFTTEETGSLYDVGGYRLYLQCEGTGGPTVVMDAGLGADHGEWSAVEPRVSTSSRVCSWDRAGARAGGIDHGLAGELERLPTSLDLGQDRRPDP